MPNPIPAIGDRIRVPCNVQWMNIGGREGTIRKITPSFKQDGGRLLYDIQMDGQTCCVVLYANEFEVLPDENK